MSIIARIYDLNARRYMADIFLLSIPTGASFADCERFMHGIQITTPVHRPISPRQQGEPSQTAVAARKWTMTRTNQGWEVQCASENCAGISTEAEPTKEWGKVFNDLCLDIFREADRRMMASYPHS